MKKLLFLLSLLISTHLLSQTSPTAIVNTIGELKAYDNSASIVLVKDSAYQGLYTTCSTCIADELIVFAGASGKKWMRNIVPEVNARPILITMAALRTLPAPSLSGLYQITDPGKQGLFKYTFDVISTDDGAMTIVNGLYRFKRIYFTDVNGLWFGLKGDSVTNETSALQAAVNYCIAANKNLYLPAGKYRTTDSIAINNNTGAHAPMINLYGDGVEKTYLYGDFSNNAILCISGSNTPYTFFRGGSIHDMSLTQSGSHTNLSGIKINGTWFTKYHDLYLNNLSGNGIYMPVRDDIYSNPDAYAVASCDFYSMRIFLNKGYGIYSKMNVALTTSTFHHIELNSNDSTGIRMGGHNIKIWDCPIASNWIGIWVEKITATPTPNGVSISDCEFDGNRVNNIFIEAGVNGEIVNNRIISRSNSRWGDLAGLNAPNVQVLFGDAKLDIAGKNYLIRGNYHRSTTDASPDTGYVFRTVNSGVNAKLEQNYMEPLDNSSAFVRFYWNPSISDSLQPTIRINGATVNGDYQYIKRLRLRPYATAGISSSLLYFNPSDSSVSTSSNGVLTATRIPKITASGALDNSLLKDNGTNVAVDNSLIINLNNASLFEQLSNLKNTRVVNISASNVGSFGSLDTILPSVRLTNGGGNHVTISANGNVIVGNNSASDNGSKFQVTGNATFSGTITATNVNNSTTIAGLRATTGTPSTTSTFYTTDPGQEGMWKWNPTSIVTDNTGTVIKATAITTGRFERVYNSAINAKWFCVADGITDDAIGLKAAVAAGNEIYLPPGTYLTSDSIPIHEGLHIYGAGKNLSVIKATHAGSILYWYGAGGSTLGSGYARNVRINDLRLDGSTIATSGIRWAYAYNWDIENVQTDSCTTGFKGDVTGFFWRFNFRFVETINGTNGFDFALNSAIESVPVSMYHVTARAMTGYGMVLRNNFVNLTVYGGEFNHCLTGVGIYGSSTKSVSLLGVSFENNTTGLDLGNSTDAPAVALYSPRFLVDAPGTGKRAITATKGSFSITGSPTFTNYPDTAIYVTTNVTKSSVCPSSSFNIGSLIMHNAVSYTSISTFYEISGSSISQRTASSYTVATLTGNLVGNVSATTVDASGNLTAAKLGIGVAVGSNYPVNVSQTAINSNAEEVARFTISDDNTSWINIKNNSSTDATFDPALVGRSSSNRAALTVIGEGTTDAGSTAVLNFQARTAAAAAVVTRPIFAWANFGTNVMTMLANGNLGINTGSTVSAKLHIISTTEPLRLGYDASNYASFTVGSTGSLTIALTGTSPTVTFNQAIASLAGLSLNGALQTNTTTTSSNFWVTAGAAIGGSTSSSTAQLDGSSNISFRILERGATSTAISANFGMFSHIIGQQTVAEFAGASTHPIMGQLGIQGLVITDDATATTTDLATVFIAGAATGITPTGFNDAFRVKTGISREEGGIGRGRTTKADLAYTLTSADYLVAYTSLTASRAVTLPTAASVSGQHFVIKDESGSASGSIKITIVGTVDGAVNPDAIITAYGKYKIYSNGTAFFTE